RAFDEIHDVFALRIIADNITDCYKILGVIHDLWKPQPGKFKDYVSVPKPNGYRSLHTTVFGPEGKMTEFQIRTREMDDEAKFGIAAHWHYKLKGAEEKKQPQWVKEILDMQRNIKDSNDLVNKAKFDIFQNRIFVFSPKGDVFELPENATPVDFAYAVHTDIGNKASVAIVNEQISTLDHTLKNGDLVEIKVDKNRKGPNTNWMKFVKTKRAKEKIKQNAQKSGFGNIKKFIPKI
ncbi:MAG TPA: TGS domain-containing protein, partial [Patescibacteria group bacterium]|nr:TGS domain-containing protein [Patescibacteria group bacterium]